MKRIRSTNDRLVDVIVFDPKKNIKLQPVTPLMPLEALLIPVNLTDSDSDGINGGTGCNFIFYPCNFSHRRELGQMGGSRTTPPIVFQSGLGTPPPTFRYKSKTTRLSYVRIDLYILLLRV